MFNIKLYKFSKKPNSLKVPAKTDGTVYECSMKTPSSIINPVIDIKYGNEDGGYSKQLPEYTYAYISDFGRYYFVNNAVWSLGIWTLTLSCDVLASFREDILNSRQYIVRSASNFNSSLIDTIYPSYRSDDYTEAYYQSDYISSVYRKVNSTGNWIPVSNYFDRDIKNGAFLIGVVSDTATGVSYYIMPRDTFNDFMSKAFSIYPSNMTDVSTGLAQTLYNAIQYITICRWYPVLPLGLNVGDATIRDINIGSQTIRLTYADNNCMLLDGTCIEQFRFTVNVPRHPQAQSTGLKYLNLSPYTELNLYFNPFGTIPIDTTKIIDADRLDVKWYVDYSTGTASLEIRDGTTDGLLYTDVAEYGVALPISTMVYDWKAGAILLGANFLKSYLSKPVAEGGHVSEYAMSAEEAMMIPEQTKVNLDQQLTEAGWTPPQMDISFVDTLINTFGVSFGQLNSKGAQGSFLSFAQDKPYLYAWFNSIVEPDIAKFGGLCYAKYRIDNLHGFTSCLNPEINFIEKNPTAMEQTRIYGFLITGFYVE